MTDKSPSDRLTILNRAALRALRAPSVHNTQPWKFVVTGDALELWVDRDRQLSVLDPRGRQLTISLGCALFNARVSIAASGYEALVDRLPGGPGVGLVARVKVGAQARSAIAHLDAHIGRRRTNRRQYRDHSVPVALLDELRLAAARERSVLIPITGPDETARVLQMAALAERLELADPEYLAELRRWTTDDPRRRDGVQAASVPYAGGEERAGDLDKSPVRQFDVAGMGWLPALTGSTAQVSLVLLASDGDEPADWLAAGEALERVWLQLSAHAYWASPLAQVVEVRETHERLRYELPTPLHPQMLLRIGQAPDVVPTRRRLARDVICMDLEP
jgi:hypothetical protein